AATPSRLVRPELEPKVAEDGNLGLQDAIPLGLTGSLLNYYRHVELYLNSLFRIFASRAPASATRFSHMEPTASRYFCVIGSPLVLTPIGGFMYAVFLASVKLSTTHLSASIFCAASTLAFGSRFPTFI